MLLSFTIIFSSKGCLYKLITGLFILVNNSFIQSLLDLIFFIQSPVAPVYIVREKEDIQKILDGEEVERCKIIYP